MRFKFLSHVKGSTGGIGTSATPPASAFPVDGVGLVKRMALLAMRLASVDRLDANSASQILTSSYRLKMCRIHAGMYSAEMVERQSGGDGANKQFIGEPISHCVPAVHLKAAITILTRRARPQPTSVSLLDESPESAFRVASPGCKHSQWAVRLGIARHVPAFVMASAPAVTYMRLIAAFNGACSWVSLGLHLEALLSGVMRTAVSAARPPYFTRIYGQPGSTGAWL